MEVTPTLTNPTLKIIMKKLILTFFLLTPTIGLTCESNFDCEIGSKCVKEKPLEPGYCVGGMNPGNQNDRNPPRQDPYEKKKGSVCYYNADCDFGQKCLKESGKMYGVCI